MTFPLRAGEEGRIVSCCSEPPSWRRAQVRRSVRQSKLPRGKQDSDDEDSDFD